MKERRRASIIGVGNLLMKDEGFGVHVVKHLERAYSFPPEVRIVDCGTAGIYMAPVFEQTDLAIVVDAAAVDGKPPGTLLMLDHQGMTGKHVQSSMSPHQLGILEILEICRLRGELPRIRFFLAVPKEIGPGLELSRELESRVPEMADIVVKELGRMGFHVTMKTGD